MQGSGNFSIASAITHMELEIFILKTAGALLEPASQQSKD